MSTPQAHIGINIGEKAYTIERTLGKGVFGEVLLAKDVETNEQVAIKKFAFNKEAFEAPLREGLENYLNGVKNKIAQLENNPSQENEIQINALQTTLANIENNKEAFLEKKLVSYYDTKRDEYNKIVSDISNGAAHEHKILNLVGEAIGSIEANENTQTYFIAMKLVKGKDLTDVLGLKSNTPNPLSPEQLVSMTTQLMDKVLSLQDKGIVLRDLHTNNIMYDVKSNELNIIDYGDALELKDGQAKGQAKGQAMGSDPYVAPEVLIQADARHGAIQDVNYNEKTTVFTAGAIISKLLELSDIVKTRQVKVDGEKPEMFRTIKLRDAETENSKIADPEIRKELLSLLENMTEKSPENRTLSLLEAKQQLGDIMGRYMQKLQAQEPTVQAEAAKEPAVPPAVSLTDEKREALVKNDVDAKLDVQVNEESQSSMRMQR